MDLDSLGSLSSANKETRELVLKAYLNQAENYNSLTALQKANVSSWQTMLNYLRDIKNKMADTLTPLGKSNLVIALREAKLLHQKTKRG